MCLIWPCLWCAYVNIRCTVVASSPLEPLMSPTLPHRRMEIHESKQEKCVTKKQKLWISTSHYAEAAWTWQTLTRINNSSSQPMYWKEMERAWENGSKSKSGSYRSVCQSKRSYHHIWNDFSGKGTIWPTSTLSLLPCIVILATLILRNQLVCTKHTAASL